MQKETWIGECHECKHRWEVETNVQELEEAIISTACPRCSSGEIGFGTIQFISNPRKGDKLRIISPDGAGTITVDGMRHRLSPMFFPMFILLACTIIGIFILIGLLIL